MQTDSRIIKKHFKKSLSVYNENAVVQKMLAQKLADIIQGSYFSKILEIGAGTGLLTEQIINKTGFDSYYANDLVEKSELYIKNFIPDVHFFAGDFRKIKFNGKFDLIASNAVFQWFENIEQVLTQCANLLEPKGKLLFSTFSGENFREFKNITGLTLNYKTQEELINLLKSKYDILKFESFEEKLKFDNPLKILAHMKNTGVNSLSEKKWGIKEVKYFCEKYKEQYTELELTYSPIVIFAQLK